MKKLSLMATLVALVMAPGIVRAEDDDDKKDVDIRVETKVSGEVMTIGPDGKVKVEKFGDDGKMEGVESLPKNIQELLKKGETWCRQCRQGLHHHRPRREDGGR